MAWVKKNFDHDIKGKTPKIRFFRPKMTIFPCLHAFQKCGTMKIGFLMKFWSRMRLKIAPECDFDLTVHKTAV